MGFFFDLIGRTNKNKGPMFQSGYHNGETAWANGEQTLKEQPNQKPYAQLQLGAPPKLDGRKPNCFSLLLYYIHHHFIAGKKTGYPRGVVSSDNVLTSDRITNAADPVREPVSVLPDLLFIKIAVKPNGCR